MKALSNFFVKLMNKYLPDPFIFCTVLTIVVFIAAIPAAKAGPLELVNAWGGGVWALLAFAMQMALVVVTGTAFATAPPIKKILQKIAGAAKTPVQGVMIVAVVAAIATFVNWGFGLVVGALLGKEVAKAVKGVDYRLVIAAGYSMFVIWHAGVSGSIPLSLKDYGIDEKLYLEHKDAIAANAELDACTPENPRKADAEALGKILECAYYGKTVNF